ncbi:MAG: class I poly(R)-hydroxyalkanoic acid synthase [Rhodospirillaceae bacterium]|nr:class I poly(R)-hydroxyalkanoic acid synthase [Rhodospirillaceae bacterium]
MADQQQSPEPSITPQELADLAERTRKVMAEFMQRHAADQAENPDPLNIAGAFAQMTAHLVQNPQKLWEMQAAFWQDYMQLWQSSMQRFWGIEAKPVIEPSVNDRRFKDKEWSENTAFDFIKQSYLLAARHIEEAAAATNGLDDKSKQKIDFYTKQFIDAMAPSNFALTNPEVVRATLETKGDNLVRGLKNLLDDIERGKGRLQITMTDADAFEVGKNIAVTPGKVVYQNDLIQLIQYTPTTPTVAKRPLLIIPPWINKFYILDLRDKNSFIKWAVAQGQTVFVVSWVNPDERLAQKSFEDYMDEGLLDALTAIEKATGEREINLIGYCLGGTLSAATLAYMAANGDKRVKSVTFFTTLVDFRDAGDLTVFIDEEQLKSLESRMSKKGYLEGADMATTFNMLRANDLIWSFVVNNYLLGKDPFPFDLLYWNSDSTRMPMAMHMFYLRKMYQENLLVKPGGITLRNVPIDLGKIKIPVCILSTREDHIAPWKATYAATQLYKGPVKFILSGSGHIAGVVNPAGSDKYGHWTSETKKYPKKPDDWFKSATQRPGSWWPSWREWLKDFEGEQVPARQPGDGKLKPLEDAPGSYVKVKASD